MISNKERIFHRYRLGQILLVFCIFEFYTSTAFLISGQNASLLGVELSPGEHQRGLPQQSVVFTHTLLNTGSLTGTFGLTLVWTNGWDVAMYTAEHDETVMLPIELGPLETQPLTVSLAAPFTAYSGTVGYLALHAASVSDSNVYTVVTDTVTVYRVPGVVLSPGQIRVARPGEVVTFSHCITNTGPLTDSFAVTALISPTWPLTLHIVGSDPQSSYLPLPPLGELESLCFDACVELPLDKDPETQVMLSFQAVSLTDDNVSAVVTDTLLVGISYQTFFPLVERYVPPKVKLGVDFGNIITWTDVASEDFPVAKAMGAEWVRVLLAWYQIETAPGLYDWGDYDPVFMGLEANELKALVTIYGAPEWAAEESCGPISDTVAFGRFIDILVPRYAGVTAAWEFINEPDGREPHHYGSVIGCWATDPLAYAVQLGDFYQRVKSLDPTTDVFYGGLAYDNWLYFERDFFTQTLALGAGNYFDGVSLHYYPINPLEFPLWDPKSARSQVLWMHTASSRRKSG